ncbi:MAG: MFS transporter [Alphaproteobacteria bacterium]|nr:MFS transporter [Alphaproteobacteria bacterium]
MTGAPTREERLILVAVALSGVLAPLNSTMLAVALPRIIDDFQASVGTAGWLMTSYLLALAVVQPVAGKLGDRFGRRHFVFGGLLVFGLASLGASVAPSLPVLIAMRTLQAIAGAIVFPNGASLLRQLIPAARRARAFGTMGAALSLAAALGPPLGGAIVAAGGWRAIFLINVPVVLAALLLARAAIPRRTATPPRAESPPFDLAGAILFPALLLGAALLAIEGVHLDSALQVAVLAVALAGAGAVFVQREAAHADPVLQPRFFTRRAFAAATLGIATSNLGFYTLLLAVPILLARQSGWSSLGSGLVLALLCAPMVACSFVGGQLADRMGRRMPVVAGCALLAAGLVPFVIEPGLAPAALAACLAITGAGVGLGSAGLQTSAVEAVAPEHAGVASGLFSTCRYVGSFLGSIALARLLDAGEGLAGFRALFAIALAGALLSVVAALLLPVARGPAGRPPSS